MLHSPLHICAIIPTFNNAGTIEDVIRRVHQQVRDIIVVDDGCTDNTKELLSAIEIPVTVVTHPRNQGKGRALASGFRKALEMGFDYALTIDSDGQHYPEDIPLLIRALEIHPNALIVGSRQFTDNNMDQKSKFANRFSNFWFRLQTTVDLPDTQTGMRIYPLHRLYGLNILTSRYEAELELLVFAAWHNVPLIPVPIRVYYPPKEERVSHFRPAYDFTRISILNTFLCIGALLFGYINMYWRTVVCFGYFGITMFFGVIPWTLLFFLFRPNTPATRARYHRAIRHIAQHYSRWIIGLRLKVDNPQNIQIGAHPSIVVANHQSLIDVLLLMAQTDKIVILVKDYIWRNPLFHSVAKYMDCFPLSLPDEAKEMLMRRVSEEGYSILLFPEGTRTTTGEIGRFHRGAFYFAELFQLPVQPVLLEGLCDYMTRRQFAIKPADVTLRILPEIPYNDTSFGANYKRRTKSLELHYHALLHAYRPSVGILGAGVGGLFTGALLAQRGFQVTLFEQLPVFGGGLYSYERNGETWSTGMHILTGLQPDGPLTSILTALDLNASHVSTIMDFTHTLSVLLGEAEALQAKENGFLINDTFCFDNIVSSLHPKQLLKITDLPLFRTVTRNRILNTPETAGSFKTYIRLKPESLPYDPVTHYLPDHHLLALTPCSEPGQVYARTIETVMPMEYEELAPWHKDRKARYAEYEAFKQQKAEQVLTLLESVYPDIRSKVVDYFTSTSLTYRDDYRSPEGAMYGMSQGVGSVRTRVPGFYLTGQNIFLHGLCGTAMTAQQTTQAICEDTCK